MAVPGEAAGFHVDHHGEVAAEAFGHLAEGGWGGVCFGHHSSLADGVGHQTAGRGYAPDAPALDHDRVRGTTVAGWCGRRGPGPDLRAGAEEGAFRSEKRRVGNECGSPCRSR